MTGGFECCQNHHGTGVLVVVRVRTYPDSKLPEEFSVREKTNKIIKHPAFPNHLLPLRSTGITQEPISKQNPLRSSEADWTSIGPRHKVQLGATICQSCLCCLQLLTEVKWCQIRYQLISIDITWPSCSIYKLLLSHNCWDPIPHFQYQGFPLLELVAPSLLPQGFGCGHSTAALIAFHGKAPRIRAAQPYWSLRWLVTFRTDHTMAGWRIPYNKWGFESENHWEMVHFPARHGWWNRRVSITWFKWCDMRGESNKVCCWARAASADHWGFARRSWTLASVWARRYTPANNLQ